MNIRTEYYEQSAVTRANKAKVDEISYLVYYVEELNLFLNLN